MRRRPGDLLRDAADGRGDLASRITPELNAVPALAGHRGAERARRHEMRVGVDRRNLRADPVPESGTLAPSRSTFRASSVFSSRGPVLVDARAGPAANKSKHMSGQSASARTRAQCGARVVEAADFAVFSRPSGSSASAFLIGPIRTNNDLSGPASRISVATTSGMQYRAQGALSRRATREDSERPTWRGST